MFALPAEELTVFVLVLLAYLAASVVAILQLLPGGRKYQPLLSPFICLAVALEAVLLVLRAAVLKAVPLTGLFESMIVLTLTFGLIYLFLGRAIRQVWFGSVMTWVILAMILMAAAVAEPALEPVAVVTTPWAIAHGISMVLASASITFATASAFLYLLGRRKLKQKKVLQVLGRMPNIEKLERMNLFGIRAGFVLLTIGFISGLGLVSMLGTGIAAWLSDVKVISIITAWVLLGAILVSNRLLKLEGRIRGYITIVAFAVLMFAILGVAILGTTQHRFS